MTADEINRSFPNIADWVQGAGWIEIGTQEWQGFIVRALGEGGGVIEVKKCKSSEKPWSHWRQRSPGRNPEPDELEVIKRMDWTVLRSSTR